MIKMLMADHPIIDLLLGQLFTHAFFDHPFFHPTGIPARVQQQPFYRSIHQFGFDVGGESPAIVSFVASGNSLDRPRDNILIDQQSAGLFHIVQQHAVFEPAGFRYHFHFETLYLTDVSLIQFFRRHDLLVKSRGG